MNKVWRIANGVFEKYPSVTYTFTVLAKKWQFSGKVLYSDFANFC